MTHQHMTIMLVFFIIILTHLSFFFFFFNDTATTEIYTLSLHDALPIWPVLQNTHLVSGAASPKARPCHVWIPGRSEEHTSELQSPCNLVCRLLLEKKKKKTHASILLTKYNSLMTCKSLDYLAIHIVV